MFCCIVFNIFAFIIIVYCILYYYVLVANFGLLILPCISLKNNNDSKSGSANELPKAEISLKVEKVYSNFAEKENLDLIKQELNGLAGVYSFKNYVTGKMYIGSSINI